MADREKVIKGWECHIKADALGCADCPYREGWRTCNFTDTLYKDVYALLKEQEAVEPTTEHKLFICPVCKNTLFREQKFCHECGQAVKWDA